MPRSWYRIAQPCGCEERTSRPRPVCSPIMTLPTQASFMSEASSIMRPEEQQSAASLAKQREESRLYFRSLHARRSRPMLSSLSMPSLATSSLSSPAQADLRLTVQRDADTAINELNQFSRRFTDHRASAAAANHSKPMRYGPADVMDALVDMEQPCPPQRAAHLVSVYGRGHSGLLTRNELQELLQDASGTSRVHTELLMAWSYVGLNRKKTPPASVSPTGRPLSSAFKASPASPSTPRDACELIAAVVGCISHKSCKQCGRW